MLKRLCVYMCLYVCVCKVLCIYDLKRFTQELFAHVAVTELKYLLSKEKVQQIASVYSAHCLRVIYELSCFGSRER